MNERFTLDTNVLVYSVDGSAGARHETARRIVERAAELDCRLTLQSLSEFYAAVTRKRLMPPIVAATAATSLLELFPTVPPSSTAVRMALAEAAAGRASYWDALLLATAREAGCSTVLTEDMADGAVICGVRVVSPFDAAGDMAEPARHLLQLD